MREPGVLINIALIKYQKIKELEKRNYTHKFKGINPLLP
jgi:hypothetical protein